MIQINKSKLSLIACLLLLLILLFNADNISIALLSSSSEKVDQQLKVDSLKISTDNLVKEVRVLDRKLQKLQPKSNYLVVNTTANEFYLYHGKSLIKQDKCSTGSYILLKNGDAQQWIFKSPKGQQKILAKTVKPVWKKPDWAFIEAGLAVPPMNHPSRFEYGVLGDYSLSLGDGYLIHGTLYQRFIGLPVTHGCIRLDKENLKDVYNHLSLGSKVYLF